MPPSEASDLSSDIELLCKTAEARVKLISGNYGPEQPEHLLSGRIYANTVAEHFLRGHSHTSMLHCYYTLRHTHGQAMAGWPDQYQYYSEASRPHKLLLIDLNHFFKITALIITSKK